MAGAPLFDLVQESLPQDAYQRRAWLTLLRCYTRIERQLMQYVGQQYDSSLPRYDVLTALALNEKGLTMGELATLLKVSKGNITGVVRRLKSDGLIRKATSKADRRIQSVTISAEGRRLWEKMHADYDRIITELMSSQSEEELATLTRALEKTLASVNEVAN